MGLWGIFCALTRGCDDTERRAAAEWGRKVREMRTKRRNVRYCPQNVCKLQSSYICGEIANQTKNNEAYS